MTSGRQELVSDVKLVSMCGQFRENACPKVQLSFIFSRDNRGYQKSSHNLIDGEVSGPQHDLEQNDSTRTSGQIHSAGSCWVQLWPSVGLRENPSLGLHRIHTGKNKLTEQTRSFKLAGAQPCTKWLKYSGLSNGFFLAPRTVNEK